MLKRVKQWAVTIKRDVVAVWIAARDPRVPWTARILAAAVAAYALSPIDLIPDFVPILGYLDDAVIVPVGILIAVRLIPDVLMDEFRAEADRKQDRPTSRLAAAAMILLWIAAFALSISWGVRR